MPQPVLNYLQLCFRDFAEVSAKLNRGRPFDLSAIERSVSHLRKNKKPLTYEALNLFLNQERWWDDPYWVWPSKEHVDPALAKTVFSLWELPEQDDRKGIEELFKVFKSIDLVSIILRFVHPEHYGILSPPIERVLEVERGNNAIETYMNYITNLRAIRQHYGFKRVADADMALWVLHAKCFGKCLDPMVKEQFENDPYMWEVRATNLVSPLASFPNLTEPQDMENTKHDLVSVVVCYLFELSVKKVAQQVQLDSGGSLQDIIERLKKGQKITALESESWEQCRKVRNTLLHEGQAPSSAERKNLINVLLEIKARA